MTVPIFRGSRTAKNGFRNETDVADKFNHWQTDPEAQQWLTIMGHDLNNIEKVSADVLHGYKADIRVQIQRKSKDTVDTENIQVKLVSSSRGFNQVDKRWLSHYRQLWNIPDAVYEILEYFTGEKLPCRAGTQDSRRMFLTEMEPDKQDAVIRWFAQNKELILTDIIKGREPFSAQWVLVAQKTQTNSRWILKNISEALQHYAEGDVSISPRGSIQFCRILIQRKGGDGGRDTAKMLQFKLDPTDLFDI